MKPSINLLHAMLQELCNIKHSYYIFRLANLINLLKTQTYFKMILLKLLCLLPILTIQQVNHTPIQPQIMRVKASPAVKTVPSKHSLINQFIFGYEISGKVYQTNEGLLDTQIHDKSFYNPSSSCQFYNSELTLDVLNQKIFSDGLNIEASEVSQVTQTIYLVLNNKNYLVDQKSTREIQPYSFSDDGYTQRPNNIPIKSLGLNDSQLLNIQILAVNQVLIVTDGVKFVGIDQKNLTNFWQISINEVVPQGSTKMDYQFASLNQMLQFELCHMDVQKNMLKIVAVWNIAIRVYHFSIDAKNATLVSELTPPKDKIYSSAVIYYNIYALIEGQLVVYRMKANTTTYQSTYIDLQSKECWGMNKYQSTLHMICKEGGVNYVSEYYFNESFELAKDALFLNRYYTQVDDARLIFMFGGQKNPKLFISGQNDLLLTAYGINRQVLIDSNQRQAIAKFKSFGLENIVSIPKLSRFNSTYAVGIATEFIVLFRINEIPSQVQCTFDRKDDKMRWNILVQINTTNCYENGQIQQLQSICQFSVPFTYYVSLFEVDSSKELTVNIFVYVVLIACGLLILGCAFHCKSIRRRAFDELQKKLKKLKKKQPEVKEI